MGVELTHSRISRGGVICVREGGGGCAVGSESALWNCADAILVGLRAGWRGAFAPRQSLYATAPGGPATSAKSAGRAGAGTERLRRIRPSRRVPGTPSAGIRWAA